jgi:hypothetical protein
LIVDRNGQLLPIVNNHGGNEPNKLRYYYGGLDGIVHSMKNVIKLLAPVTAAAAPLASVQHDEHSSMSNHLARGSSTAINQLIYYYRYVLYRFW